MAKIEVYEGTRLPLLGFPCVILAVEERNQIQRAEAHVFILDDRHAVTHRDARSVRVDRSVDAPLSDQIDERLLLEEVKFFAEQRLTQWQNEKCGEHGNPSLLAPTQLQERGNRLLFRFWMGQFAVEELRDIAARTRCVALRACIEQLRGLPQLVVEEDM